MWNYILIVIFIFPLLPFLYIQGLYIQRKVRKLPEAEGDSGITGKHFDNIKHILIIGESTMAGVGSLMHQTSFAGTLASKLSEKLKVKIHWKVYAKRGLTINQITKQIIPSITESRVDLIIIGIGGNDTFALRSPIRWIKHIKELTTLLKRKYNAPIAFLNMPPIQDFPAFSYPLKVSLGRLSEILRKSLHKFTAKTPEVFFNHKVIRIKDWVQKYDHIDKADLFSDGVHPSEITYQLWAKDFANYLLSNQHITNVILKQSH